MNKYILTLLIIIIVVAGAVLWYRGITNPVATVSPAPTESASATPVPTPTSPLPVPSKGDVVLPNPTRAPAPTKNEGTVTFAIKDKAESLDNFQYILVQLVGVSAHSAKGPWVSMKSTPPLLDLLKIYRTEKQAAFLTELNMEAGTYDQIRLDIGNIVLVTKDGAYHDAKLPSKQIKMNMHLVVTKGGKSSVVIDIVSAKSIHSTGKGTYIFAPVVNLETRSQLAETQLFSSGFVTLIGGKTDTTIDAGMDENGDMKKDFSFAPNTDFDIIGNAIRVIPVGENEADIKVTADQAVDIAVQSGNVASVISLKISRRAGAVVWQVRGVKIDGGMQTVFINAVSGAVMGTE